MGDDVYLKVGPVGRRSWGDVWDEKGHANIVQIFLDLNSSGKINSIQFQYVENGSVVVSKRQGSDAGRDFYAVKFDFPREYITQVRGHTDQFNEVCSLAFDTNLGEYGPYGQVTSKSHNNLQPFSFRLGDNNQFGGFHGTADSTGVCSIGVYLKLTKDLVDGVRKNDVKIKKERGDVRSR